MESVSTGVSAVHLGKKGLPELSMVKKAKETCGGGTQKALRAGRMSGIELATSHVLIEASSTAIAFG